MGDTAGVDKRVFNGFDTRYLLSGRGVPDELCSPFDFCASQVISLPRDGAGNAFSCSPTDPPGSSGMSVLTEVT